MKTVTDLVKVAILLLVITPIITPKSSVYENLDLDRDGDYPIHLSLCKNLEGLEVKEVDICRCVYPRWNNLITHFIYSSTYN